MSSRGASASAPTLLIVAAFLCIYFIWGSTYLAIRFVIESMPPLLMAGARLSLAGLLMYAWARLRGTPKPERIHWRSTAIIGALLFLCGNGGVVLSETMITSSMAALLVATMPMWMTLLEWLRTGVTPALGTIVGLLSGFAGVAVLVGPSNLIGGENAHPFGAMLVVLGCLGWAAGSLYSREAPLPKSAVLMTGMEMLCGGIFLTVAGLLRGELVDIHPEQWTDKAIWSWVYLVTIGSIVGFTAYAWLLRVVSPARVSTYAYVNPVVAVLLGATLGGEPITPQLTLGSIIIIASVAAMVTFKSRPSPTAASPVTSSR